MFCLSTTLLLTMNRFTVAVSFFTLCRWLFKNPWHCSPSLCKIFEVAIARTSAAFCSTPSILSGKRINRLNCGEYWFGSEDKTSGCRPAVPVVCSCAKLILASWRQNVPFFLDVCTTITQALSQCDITARHHLAQLGLGLGLSLNIIIERIPRGWLACVSFSFKNRKGDS